jgi:V/A-type H+-transporting ATPase subunit I
MIVPMMKYSMVLFYKDYRAFLEQLQELGLVDVTISAWQANDDERRLIDEINDYKNAAKQLKLIAADAPIDKNFEKNLSAQQALETYKNANNKLAKLKTELDKISKEAAETLVWGEFDTDYTEKLKQSGIALHFYELSEKRFAEFKTRWQEKYSITEINNVGSKTYFVIAAFDNETFEFDLAELKPPSITHAQALQNIENINIEIREQQNIVNQNVAYIADFTAESTRLSDNLHLAKATNSGEPAADGKLILLEGWAAAETQKDVEKLLDNSDAFYIKEKPTPDDNTPVKLKNNRFARLFEFIEQFYTLPKYGTTDMTPYCAPFYILFFGFCLGDGGYGLIFLILGLFIAKKMKNALVRSVGWLAFWCGAVTLLFGILTDSFFGAGIIGNKILDSKPLFFLAIAIGLVHLLFGMGIKAYGKAKYFGFKYALSTIGWMIVLVSAIAAFLLPKLGLSLPYGNTILLVAICLGAFLMLFCNSPGKNIFINFGAGLWNTYNDVTGILGDTLSYLRLFALGMSGSILAMVFNSLAMGMSPDVPVLKEIVVVVILLFGHILNLCMNALGAFVHPMRLTFVEFYKNAGFEAGQRAFTPLKKGGTSD